MGLELFCATLIALLFGLTLCFVGYRLFLILLPIWGFFFGFALGAETLQALFGVGFLASISSWVVGFIVGAIFAVLSYLFYIVGVAILAGSLGYALGAGFMHLIGIDLGFLVWIVGIVVAIALAVVTIMFNIQKYVIIVATALGGAGMMIGTLVLGVGGMTIANMVGNPVRLVLQNTGWLWTLIFIVVAGAGIFVQIVANRDYEIEAYENRI
jgi:hypothetical protein